MNDLERAKQKLFESDYKFVFVKGEHMITSFESGIKALTELYSQNLDLSEYSAADRIVGKAAAFIYLLLKVKNIYAEVISESAYELLRDFNVEYGKIVPYIINRKGDGLCPMEDAVKDIADPELAYNALKQRIAELKKP